MNLRHLAAVLVVALSVTVQAEDRQLEAAKAKYTQEIEKARVSAENAQNQLIAAYGAAIARADGLVKMKREPDPTPDQLREELAAFRDQILSLPSLVAKPESLIPLGVPILLKSKSGSNQYMGIRDANVVMVESKEPVLNQGLHFRALPIDGADGKKVLFESVQRPGWLLLVPHPSTNSRLMAITDKDRADHLYTAFVPQKPLYGQKGVSIHWPPNKFWLSDDGEGHAVVVPTPPLDPKKASFEIIPIAP